MIPHVIEGPEATALDWERDLVGQLRVDSEEEKARVMDALVGTATGWAQRLTNRQLITATIEFWFSSFADACAKACRHPGKYSPDTILVPRPPLQSLTHIKYYDTANVLQTLASSNYTVVAPQGDDAGPAWIRPVPAAVYPNTYCRPDAVQIRVVCGYGDEAADIPAGIRQGMALYVAEMFERREMAVTGTIVAAAPIAAEQLAGMYLVEV